MSSYRYELSEAGGTTVLVTLTGELDLTNARELEARLAEAAPGDSLLAVDLNGVSFIDSAVLHVLFKLVRRRGGDRVAIVVDSAAPVATVLRIAGLDRAARFGSSIEALEPEAAKR